MGSDVVADANRLNRITILLKALNLSELRPYISRPERHALLDRKGQVNVPDHRLAWLRKGLCNYAGPARGETLPAFFSFFSSLLSLRDLAGFFFASFFVSLLFDITLPPRFILLPR